MRERQEKIGASFRGGWRLRVCAAFAVSASVLTASAATYWVDANSTVAPETGAEAAPFTKIQSAVNLTKEGDTVYVRPGTYGDNQGVVTETTANTQSRLLLSGKKNVSIIATGSAADTAIVGYRAAETIHDDNICCVTILKSPGSVLRGFTITGGGGRATNSSNSFSGGVNDPNGSYGSDATAFVVDCVITNCLGTRGGGARGVNLVRCRLEANKALNPLGNKGGQAASRVNAYFCLFANHMSGDAYTVDYPTKVVNCTFLYNNQGKSTQFVLADTTKNVLANCTFANVNGYGDGATMVKAVNCAVGPAKIGDCLFGDGGGNICSQAGSYLATRTAFGVMDGHPLSSSVCGGKGSRDALAYIPEAYRDRDLDGRLIGPDDAVNIGCYQTATPDYGCILFDTDKCQVEGYGTAAISTYLHPSTPYEQFRVKPSLAAGSQLWSIYVMHQGQANENYHVFPDPEGWCYVTPRNLASCRTKISTQSAQAVFYAAPDGDDANDGLSPAKPKTLQGAVNARASASTITLVLAAAGEYASGSTISFEHNTRLAIPNFVTVRGAGIGKTIIRGQKDPNWQTEEPNYYGRGVDAVRCVTMTGTCCLQGVTLSDGYTTVLNHQDAKASNGTNGGGVCGESANSCCLMDSEVDSCVASRAASLYQTRAIRCRIHGCRETNNSNAQNATLINCYLYGNTPNNGVIGTSCKAYNCTVDLNGNYLSTGDGVFRNCIFFNGNANRVNANGGMTNCLIDVSCANLPFDPSCRKADACFVDRANGDLRVTSLSPAVGFGILDANFDRYSEGPMDLVRLQKVNGRPTCGAWQVPVQAYYVSKGPGVSVSRGTAGVTNLLAAGESVTVTATGEDRLVDHFRVDGTDLDASVRSVTITAPATGTPAAGGSVSFEIVPHLYADAENGSEANDGLTAATPKRQLDSVLTKALAGDTVHLAAGRYAEGSMLHSSACTIRSRGVVPSGVTLVGDEGAEKTFICGAASTDAGADAKGLGAGAMRCLSLGANAVARGLTFTDGRTAHPGTGGQPDNEDLQAGGVLGTDFQTSLIEDCVISNCVSKRTVAARNVTYVRCRILNNWAAWNGAGGGNLRAIDTYFANNQGENTVQPAKQMINCTYAPNNYFCEHLTYAPTVNGTVPFVFDSTQGTNILNSIIASPHLLENFRAANCVFLTCSGYNTLVTKGYVHDCLALTTLSSQWKQWFDADGKIIDRSFVGVDMGNAGARARYAQAGDIDLAGDPRVYNGAIDAGAREFDWRGAYAAFLGRRLTVTEASPAVRLAADRIVLPNGASLVARAERPVDCTLAAAFGVTGSAGTLTVDRDGETVGTYGPGTYEKTQPLQAGVPTEIGFTFAGSDDSSGYLKHLKASVGTLLIVR